MVMKKGSKVNNPFGPPEPKEESKLEDVALDGQASDQTAANEGEYGNDPPLLEDLDIDIVKIKYKFIAILTQRGFD